MNSVSPDENTLIALGLIGKPRGLSGELVVRPYNANSRSFNPGLTVVIKTEKSSLNTKIEYAKRLGHRFGVKFHGIDSCDAAEKYRNGELLCRFGLLPKKTPGEYLIFELVGLNVVDNRGKVFGKIKDVLNMPANDVLVIETAQKEILVPFIEQVVDSISIEQRFVKIGKIGDFYDED